MKNNERLLESIWFLCFACLLSMHVEDILIAPLRIVTWILVILYLCLSCYLFIRRD